ncbi:MAG: SH3 domain-containing protein [Lachnospiraceae bacterium]|nr:SH3 domain-containing protein [Lachnospiraceae bacterium]
MMKAFLVGKVYNFIAKHSLITATTLFAVVVAVVALVVFSVSNKETSVSGEQVNNISSEEIPSEESVQDDIQDLTLLCDAYPEINEVMVNYHNALAENDEETIRKYLLYVNENELVNIAVKSQYVESYSDIHCYTQEGFEEGSYYVYVSYQLKLTDYDVLIPGLIGLYYCPNEAGEYHIYRKADMSENVLDNYYTAYMKQEVQDLYNTVDMNYNEILDSNPDLKTYMTGFEEMVTAEMVKMIAIREASEAMQEAESESVTSEPESASETPEVVTETVKATTTVNVRSSDSETADKLGKVTTGTTLTRLESRVNGWSKVLYEGEEGFIKSEFLEVVSTDTTGNATTGYVTVKENVNIREEASETADRVALAYQGTKLELIEHMSNGWTKINYNGEVAYVKSEYVE